MLPWMALILLNLSSLGSCQTCKYDVSYGCDDNSWQMRATIPRSICYKIFLRSVGVIHSYDQAERICNEAGAEIGRIKDSVENNHFIYSWNTAIANYQDQITGHIVLGARDDSELKKSPAFIWSYDNTYMSWTNWQDGQPTRYSQNIEERCVGVRIGYGPSNLTWNDVPCTFTSVTSDAIIGVFCVKDSKPVFRDY